MRIFLNGGGDGEKCLQAYKKLNEIIDHKKPILYIPIAMEKEKYDDCKKWIKNELKDIEVPAIKIITSGTELSNENLDNYSALFIGGGNTFKLLNELKSSGAFEKYYWESYINNPNFSKMLYKNVFLKNYKKYNSMLKRANERLNSTNKNQTICHLDMDPKNVMWSNNNPIIIDWECAGVANPEKELLEVALCWSGFLSNNFSEEKFIAIFKEYSKYRNIEDIEWYDVICGNLVGRFGWLKYNLERSLGIVSKEYYKCMAFI